MLNTLHILRGDPIGHWGECTTDLLIYDLYNNGCNRLTG